MKRRQKWSKKYSFHGANVILSGWKRRLLRVSLQRGVTEGGQSETFIVSFEKLSAGRSCRFRSACLTMLPMFLNSSRRFFPPIRLTRRIYIYIYICRLFVVARWRSFERRYAILAHFWWKKVARPRIEHFVPSRCLVFLRSVGKKNDSLTAACIEDAHVVLFLYRVI